MSERHFTLEELSAYLDGELDFDDRQRAHLKDCPECTRVFEGQRTLRRIARDAAPAIPTDQMWTAIKAKIGEEIKSQIAETGGRKHDTGRSAKAAKAKATKPGGFRWGPGAWLGLSSALAAAGVLLIIRPAVEESGQAPSSVPTPASTPVPPRAPAPEPTRPAEAGKAPAKPAGSRSPSRKKSDLADQRAGTAHQPAKRRAGPKAAEPVESPPVATATGGRADSADAPQAAVAEQPAELAAAPAVNESAAPRSERRAAQTRSAAPVATAPMAGAMAPAPARRTWTAPAFVLTADRLDTANPSAITASGRVVVRPAISGSPYLATIDGVSRTLTGEATGTTAEILHPGPRLILRTTHR